MTPIDILFDQTTLDLAIVNGDLVIGDSTQQHQFDIIKAGKGHYHHAPALGVGIDEYLLDAEAMGNLQASIRLELERDGMDVDSVEIQPDGSIQVQAIYP